ncbi:hypothetical protein HGRIS_009241 [Hohenbuehelia grisea]|uniref:Uncharacterized protein n=1 Tax=Hohenbuehelia grisea TaxID=104357 RepID=A0ABR3J0J1_9AGAR
MLFPAFPPLHRTLICIDIPCTSPAFHPPNPSSIMFNNFSTLARCPTHKVRHDACPPNCIDSLRMSSRTGFANTSQSGDSTSTVGVDSPKPRRGSGALDNL